MLGGVYLFAWGVALALRDARPPESRYLTPSACGLECLLDPAAGRPTDIGPETANVGKPGRTLGWR